MLSRDRNGICSDDRSHNNRNHFIYGLFINNGRMTIINMVRFYSNSLIVSPALISKGLLVSAIILVYVHESMLQTATKHIRVLCDPNRQNPMKNY